MLADNPKFRFGLNETALGMTPPIWLTALAERTAGQRGAEIVLQRGLLLPAEDAHRIGYIDDLASDESDLDEKVMRAMNQMLAVGQGARAECKYNQRREVLELSGKKSVDYMAPRILGEEFQSMGRAVLEQLAARKAKK